MNVFDQIAQRYDSPKQVELADIITKEIRTHLKKESNTIGLDYGCGTGLIGLQLADYFKEMLFVDPSKEMIHVVDKKIEQSKRINVKTVVGRFSNGDTLNIKADLIIVSLVLLHVPETQNLLKSLYQALNPSGRILLIDFDKNENVQHEKVHNGFSQIELKEQFERIGFTSVSSKTFHHGQNIFMNQNASMFILTAEK